MNPSSEDATLYVMVEVEGKLELRYYLIKDMLLITPPVNLVESDISNFIFDKTDLIVLKEEQNEIILTNVRLSDLSKETFSLKNESKLVENFVKNKFVIMEFENKSKQIDLFVLDLRNRRFLKIDYKERYDTNKLTILNQINEAK